MNIENLKKLRKLISKVPAKYTNMRTEFSQDGVGIFPAEKEVVDVFSKNECGTACCFVGFVAVAMVKEGYSKVLGDGQLQYYAICEWLGIDKISLNAIFSGSFGSGKTSALHLKGLPAKRAILKQIDYMIETGNC